MRTQARRSPLARQLLATVAVAVGLTFVGSASAIVYTASNESTGNQVIAFDVDRHGRLKELGRFDTQGLGTGEALGNQSALTTDASDRWLFVVNPGDGTLTSFRLQENGLQLVDLEESSGGYRPISVTVFGTLVYVLNEGDGVSEDPKWRYDNISGFRFTAGGLLEPIPNSTRIIDDTQLTAPAQVGFNKSGTVLLVTEKATNTLTTYVMGQDGTPAQQPLKRPSAVPTPFGFEFGDRDFVFITEANQGARGVTASYRIDRETGAVSDLVDLIEQGDATCWTVLSSDQTLGYSVNTGSGTVSIYKVGFAGSVSPFFSGHRDTRWKKDRRSHGRYGERRDRGWKRDRAIPTGAGPRDAALSQDNQHLFVLNNGEGTLRVFAASPTGDLRSLDAVGIPDSATGAMAR